MTTTWHPLEIALDADDPGDDPYGANLLSVRFEHSSGTSISVPGFWDGGNTFKVRFAPPKPGTWSWTSDSVDPGLQDSGTVEVEQADSTRPLHVHGYLSAGERVFEHADGTPFFWLADTAWSASTRATIGEWEEYLEHRDDQGFNVVQINALRQHDGSRPHDRLPFGDEWDLSRPNHDYFHHLDEMVEMCHGRGIVTALVALWFDYAPGANVDWGVPEERRHEHSPEQARTLGRYLGARYGAYGATWLVSGDSEFNEECVAVYREAGDAIGASCQYPLRTAHQPGGQNTPTIVNEEEWVDYHMYQSGHTHDRSVPERQAIECRLLDPARPVLNGEPCYAEMNAHSTDELLDRETVRAAGWLSVLSGANAGLTYGVLGIWPWHREGDTFEGANVWGNPNPWDESLMAPSAGDYSLLAETLSQCAFETLSPRPDTLEGKETGEAAAVLQDAVLVYLEEGRDVVLHEMPPLETTEWLDPETGDTHDADGRVDDETLRVPGPTFEGDAVFIGRR